MGRDTKVQDGEVEHSVTLLHSRYGNAVPAVDDRVKYLWVIALSGLYSKLN